MNIQWRVWVGAAFFGLLLGLTALAQQTQTRSVDGLLFDLKHPDPDRRIEAARLLGMNKVRSAVPNLVEAAQDESPDVRYAVANALVQIGDTRALPAFIRLARDSETRTRKLAVQGIVDIYVAGDGGFVAGFMKVVTFLNPLSAGYDARLVEPYIPVSEEAVNALIDMLFVDDAGLRKDAATALGILRAKKALQPFQELLGKETSSDVKIEVVRSIYKIGLPEGGDIIVPLLNDPDKSVRDEAILTAGRLRTKAAVPILDDYYRAGIEERRKVLKIVPVSGPDDLQRKVLEALSYIGDSSSVDIFTDALADSRDYYRRYAAEGLGRADAKDSLNAVATAYLREKSASAKLAMGYALFLLGREEHLVEIVDRCEDDQAFYYLLELPETRIPLLYPFLNNSKEKVKARLIEVIGLKGPADALSRVQEYSGSGNADVASAANLAIRRLRARFPG